MVFQVHQSNFSGSPIFMISNTQYYIPVNYECIHLYVCLHSFIVIFFFFKLPREGSLVLVFVIFVIEGMVGFTFGK